MVLRSAQFGCQLVLCQTQRFEQILICLCLFHRVELFPLDVLNQGELQKLVVGNVSNDGRYLEQPRPLSGCQASLACYELVTISKRSYENGLQDSVFPNGGSQFLRARLLELEARLVGIGFYPVDIYFVRDYSGRIDFGNQRTETFTQRFPFHDLVFPSQD